MELGRMPPSPEHMVVFTAAEPLAKAVFASELSAPKDMCVIKKGN